MTRPVRSLVRIGNEHLVLPDRVLPPVRSARTPRFGVQEWDLEGGMQIPAHRHDRFALVLQLRGSFAQELRGREVTVVAGDALTVPIDELHSERISREGSRALIVTWNPDVPSPPGGLAGRFVHINTETTHRVGQELLRELARPDDLSTLGLESGVLHLTVLLGRREEARFDAPPPWLCRVKEVIDDEFLGTPDLADLAATAGVSRGHLCRTFRVSYGLSVGDYVRGCRVRRAAELLKNSSDPISRVALAAGFYDQSHLTRVFKRWTGTTPLRYRDSR